MQLSSPFHGPRTVFELPATITPGVPFPCVLTAVNHSEEEIFDNRLRVVFGEGVRIVDSSLSINGRRMDSSLTRNVERELRLNLAPRAIDESFTVSFEAVYTPPHASADSALVGCYLLTPETEEHLTASARVEAKVEFRNEHTLYRVSGANEVFHGEQRTVTVVIVNDGTIAAKNTVLTLNLHDLDGESRYEIGELVPGDVKIFRSELTVTGKDPHFGPLLSYDGGAFHFPDHDFSYQYAVVLSAQELVANSEFLFNLDGELVATPGTASMGPAEHNAVKALTDVNPQLGKLFAAMYDHAMNTSGQALTPLEPVSFRPYKFHLKNGSANGAGHAVFVKKPFFVVFELLQEDERTVDYVEVGFNFGPGLQYTGGLQINGEPYADQVPEFGETPRLVFRSVQPGAVMQIGFDVQSLLPTLRGTKTTLGAYAQWSNNEQRVSAVLTPFDVRPRAFINEGPLPFEVGSPRGLALKAPAARLPIAPTVTVGEGAATTPQAPLAEEGDIHVPDRAVDSHGPIPEMAPEMAATDAPAAPETTASPIEATVLHENGALDTLAMEAGTAAETTEHPAHEVPAAASQTHTGAGLIADLEVNSFEDVDRNRILGRIQSALKDQQHFTGVQAVAVLAALLPTEIVTKDATLLDAYRVGLMSMRRVINAATMRADAVNAPVHLRPQEVEDLHESMMSFGHFGEEEVGFPSTADGKPSLSACIAAFALLCGKQFPFNTSIGRAAEDYGTALLSYCASLDALDSLRLVEALSQNAPAELAESARASYTALAVAMAHSAA